MQPNTELFRLKELLLEALTTSGCLPWRDLEAIEVDLGGGELILRLARNGLEFFPLVARFCRANGLELRSWDPEEKECHLGLRPPSAAKSEGSPKGAHPLDPDKRPTREESEHHRAYRASVRAAYASQDPEARLEAGRAAWALGRTDFARAWFEKVLALPKQGSAWFEALLWVGFCHHREAGQGDAEALIKARANYEEVLSQDPTNFYALINLGKLAELEGRLQAAAACYRMALELKPEDSEAARLLRRLDRERDGESSA